jgi:polysaccharide biosynthesis protein PslG
VRARVLLLSCCLAGSLLAGDTSIPLADFDGPNPLKGWTASNGGSLTLGPGHKGHGAVLAYELAAGGSATAMWTPARPIAVRHRATLSVWVRSSPQVKLAALVRNRNGQTTRYPFEAVTLENPDGDWRQVVIPLAAEGRFTSLGISAEARFPMAIRGTVSFDDVCLLASPDQTFELRTDMALSTVPAGAGHLAPRFGVNIHGIDDERMLDLGHAAGFSFVRADLLWRAVERNGQYRFVVADRLAAALEARGMGALWILDYGHPQHGGDVPRRLGDVAAFALYAEAVAAHFRGRNMRYEIWNEPNIDRFWPPHPNAIEYATLARSAVEAIHRADPDARVAIGGLARIDLPFLEQILAAGAIGDAVSVHPYRTSAPESVAAELPLLQQLVNAKLGANVEIWDTEWGYASYDYFSQALGTDGHSAAGRKRQAVLGCREALTVWALGLPVAVWYDLRDDGDDPRNGEKNYGLIERQYGDKPAMIALRRLMHLAPDHTFAGLVEGVPDGVHAMRLDGATDRIFVVWNEQPDAHITLRLPSTGLVSATNLLGEPLNVRKNEIALAETDGPIYLEFSAAR